MHPNGKQSGEIVEPEVEREEDGALGEGAEDGDEVQTEAVDEVFASQSQHNGVEKSATKSVIKKLFFNLNRHWHTVTNISGAGWKSFYNN